MVKTDVPMRKISYIVLHCTATQPEATVAAISRYWKEQLGWKHPGYHFIIETDGNCHSLQPISLPANGVAGYNGSSIHISYIGGIDKQGKPKDTRTDAQKAETLRLLHTLLASYPNARVLGHRDFPNVKKACPSFDVKAWLKKTDIPVKNY